MPMANSVEVVDLTASPPRNSGPDIELVAVVSRQTVSIRSPKSQPSQDSTATPSKPSESQRDKPRSQTKSKRKHAPSPQNPSTPSQSNAPQDDQQHSDLFYIDIEPTVIVSQPEPLFQQEKTKEEDKSTKLLLPAHVLVSGDTPIEVIPISLSEGEDSDFIDYLDFDDVKNITRYYDEEPKNAQTVDRTVCKNCGAQGEHKTSACPVMICLTCGARDEHSTRSCPISKVCYTCGMKGHINLTCPNRRKSRGMVSIRETECERCSSSSHMTNECPTWWRLYEYLSSEGQAAVLENRRLKKQLRLGEGGEGYVASDEWCYNCGAIGHWGDDCYDLPSGHEYSAFGLHNLRTGPFYDPSDETKLTALKPPPSDRKREDEDMDWGNAAPDQVGRKSRIKSRAALAKQAQQTEEDDRDSWFTNPAKRVKSTAAAGSSNPKKITFGKIGGGGKDSSRNTSQSDSRRPPPEQRSLLDRLDLGDKYHDRDRDRDPPGNRRDKNRSSRRDSQDSRRRSDFKSGSQGSSSRNQRDTGPRYRGGYTK